MHNFYSLLNLEFCAGEFSRISVEFPSILVNNVSGSSYRKYSQKLIKDQIVISALFYRSISYLIQMLFENVWVLIPWLDIHMLK